MPYRGPVLYLTSWRLPSRYPVAETLARLRACIVPPTDYHKRDCLRGEVSEQDVVLYYYRGHRSSPTALFGGRLLPGPDAGSAVLTGGFGLSFGLVFIAVVFLFFFAVGLLCLFVAAFGTSVEGRGAFAVMGGCLVFIHLLIVGVGVLAFRADRGQIVRILTEACAGEKSP